MNTSRLACLLLSTVRKFASVSAYGVGLLWICPAVLSADSGNLSEGAANTVRVWSERQRNTTSFDIAWTATFFDLYSRRPHAPPEKIERSYRGSERLAVDDAGNARLEGVNPPRDPKGDVGEPVISTSGAMNSSFLPSGPSGYPFAEVSNVPSAAVNQMDRTIAIRLFYRALDGPMAVVEDHALVPNETPHTTFRGDHCLVLDSGRSTIWVTDDERRLPVRYFKRRMGSVHNLYDLTIDYREHDTQGWMPAGWNLVTLGIDGSTILRTMKAMVTHCTIKQPLTTEAFTIDLPPGTWVNNLVTGETRILREGQPDRIVLKGEFTGDNYEQLLNSEPPSVAGPNTEQTTRWLWIGNGGLVLTGILLWFWRSRKARRAAAKDKVELKDDV